MTVPKLESGLPGYPLAHLSDDGGEVAVMCLPLDMLCLPERIALIKIDVEGHELRAIKVMKNLIARDHPVLIAEGLSDDIASYLRAFGYSFEQAARLSQSGVQTCFPDHADPVTASSAENPDREGRRRTGRGF